MFRAFAVAVRGVAVAWRQELHLKLHIRGGGVGLCRSMVVGNNQH